MSSTVTLAQIATYAQVQRPSVSNWRRRHADFPEPTGGTTTRPLFDADEVASWLDRRPAYPNDNGPDSSTYGDLFRIGLRRSAPAGGAELDGDTFAQLGLELVALRAAHQQPLPADMVALAAVCASAEVNFPDLAGLFTHCLGHQPVVTVMLTDIERLVSELGTGGAAEQILSAARLRGWSATPAETAGEICDLAAQLTGQLLGDLSELTVADLAAGPGRLLTSVCNGGNPSTIVYAETDPVRAAWLRLRLFCHGHRHPTGHADGQATDAFVGTDIVLADPPFQSGEQAEREEHPLSWAARVVECLDAEGLGFVVVPEWTLTRTATARRLPVTWMREQLIRRGCVRAIIQLPRHLHPIATGTDLALLILRADDGDSSRSVVMCDAAAMRTRFGSSWVTRTVELVCNPSSRQDAELCRAIPAAELAGRRSLLPAHLLTPDDSHDNHRLDTVRARESAITVFATGADPVPLLRQITVTDRAVTVTRRSIGELLRGGQLVRLPGHRISDTDLAEAGQRVLGRDELLGKVSIGQRRIDVMTLGQYGAAAITEPGDVILMTGEHLRAIVDEAGGSVLLTPVQGLRIPGYVKHTSVYRDEPQQAWIGPYALAALLGAARNVNRAGPRVRAVGLHQLDIPVLTPTEYQHLDHAAMLLTELTEQTRRQTAALEQVRYQLATGLADGALNLRLKPSTSTSNI